MASSNDSPIVVCLGYPAVQAPAYLERLRAVDPRIEPVALPVDADGDWINVDAGIAHEEPPSAREEPPSYHRPAASSNDRTRSRAARC